MKAICLTTQLSSQSLKRNHHDFVGEEEYYAGGREIYAGEPSEQSLSGQSRSGSRGVGAGMARQTPHASTHASPHHPVSKTHPSQQPRQQARKSAPMLKIEPPASIIDFAQGVCNECL